MSNELIVFPAQTCIWRFPKFNFLSESTDLKIARLLWWRIPAGELDETF